LRVEQTGQGPVVWISGELDIAAAPLLLDGLDDCNGQRVTIDFSGVTFLDMTAVSVLMRRHSKLGAGALILRGIRPAHMKLLQITGLDEVFNFDE
jgi:anti-anti-sigma factor